jgi:pimeloyl-ACP methyl ester carboxylesterase
MTAMVNYYRAAGRSLGDPGPDAPVRPQTLILWGRDDTFLVPGLATDSAAQCADARVEYVNGATHWLHHEEPDRVVASISKFIGPPTR